MTILSRWQAWRERRRIAREWPMSAMVERLRIQLDQDSRWLASNPIATALIARYQTMLLPRWYQIATEEIRELRERLGLDPFRSQPKSETPPSGTLTREQVDEMSLDATRLRWLTEDHHDPLTRMRRNEILVRIRVISHSAAVAAIDIAIHEAMEREALAAGPTPSAP